MRRQLAAALLGAALLTGGAQAVAEPTAARYVADEADVLSSETEQYIIDKNQSLFEDTGGEIVVVSVDFMDGMDAAVLLAKTEALIRRSRGGGAETLACGAITLEPGRRACTVGGRLVALPPREYELLLCLMRNKGQVLRREQLLDKVWGIDFEGGDRAVDGRIKALRAALGPAGKQIRTVFKVGYKLEEGAHG